MKATLNIKHPKCVESKEVLDLVKGWLKFAELEFKRATGKKLYISLKRD